MKNLILILIIVAGMQLGACKKDNTGANKAVTGKWQLSRNLLSTGGPGFWQPAADNVYVQFNINGIITGNAFPGFITYMVKDTATLTMYNADKTSYEDYRYKVTADSLTMSPAGPTTCVEGCAMQFARK